MPPLGYATGDICIGPTVHTQSSHNLNGFNVLNSGYMYRRFISSVGPDECGGGVPFEVKLGRTGSSSRV